MYRYICVCEHTHTYTYMGTLIVYVLPLHFLRFLLSFFLLSSLLFDSSLCWLLLLLLLLSLRCLLRLLTAIVGKMVILRVC